VPDLLGLVSLFPVYWTLSTSFKVARNVMQGSLLPWIGFEPNWLGWRSLGLSPDTIFATSTVRDEFLGRFTNSIIASAGASPSRSRSVRSPPMASAASSTNSSG